MFHIQLLSHPVSIQVESSGRFSEMEPPLFAHPERGQAKTITEATKRWLNKHKQESSKHNMVCSSGWAGLEKKLQKSVRSALLMHQWINQLWVVLKAEELLRSSSQNDHVIPKPITTSVPR